MTTSRAPRGHLARGVSAAAAVTLGIGGFGLANTATAAADDSVSGVRVYDLNSDATAVQSVMTDPNVPFGLPFEVGSYGASALLNSNGESTADAGAPYSPLVSSLPNSGNGIAGSVFGQGLPVVPTFPGYVSARDPVLPKNKQTAGGYELVATALPTSANGTVSIGGQAATADENNAFARANSIANADGVLAEAAAGVHALTLGGILDLADVSSYASIAKDSTGRAVPTTTTSLGTVSLAGLSSGLTADGFSAFGSTPTPVSVDGLAALNDALKPSGITLTYLPEQYLYVDGTSSTGPTINTKKEVAGVVSAALQIFFSNTSDRGTTTETITVGRVAVNATSSTVGAVVDGAVGGAGGVSPGGTGAASAGAGLPFTAGGADLAAIPGAVFAPGAAGASNLPVSGSPATLPTQSLVAASSPGGSNGEGTLSFENFYLFLALGGAVALIAGQMVRVVAVRRSA